jgi:hypothetical protein
MAVKASGMRNPYSTASQMRHYNRVAFIRYFIGLAVITHDLDIHTLFSLHRHENREH